MKRFIGILATALAVLFLASSCSEGSEVLVSFALTDAPIDESVVTAVNVTVSEVAINESADGNIPNGDGSWKTVTIDPPVTLNLLDLRDGLFAELGEPLVLEGGTQINQIRLGVDSVAVMEGETAVTTTMPSSTGLKISNAFQVPLSGAISVTIDFDVRKSVVDLGTEYLVKPALRAVLDNEAGKVVGTVPAGVVAVYAYANDAYLDAEATTANADGLYFTGAYTSALAKMDSSYVLAYMDAGVYDLYGADASGAIVAALADVTVTADATTPGAALIATTP